MTSMKMEYIKRIKGSRHISDVNKAVKALLKDLGYPEIVEAWDEKLNVQKN